MAGRLRDRHGAGSQTDRKILLLEPTVLITLVRRSNHLHYLDAVTREIGTVNTCIILWHSMVRMLKLFIRVVCITNHAALGGAHI